MWGCDEPAQLGKYWEITCPRCDGFDLKCEVCGGSGYKKLDRCPASFLSPQIVRALEQHSAFEKGVPPHNGAWDEQSVLFRRLHKLIAGEASAIRREQAKAARKRAQARENHLKTKRGR